MSYHDHQHEILFNILNRSYEIEANTSATPPSVPLQYTLVDEEDKDILMHRDAHFAGNFDLMIEAYADEKVGATLDVRTSQIEALKRKEVELGSDIAPILLSGADAERIVAAKKMYKELRELFEMSVQQSVQQSIPHLVAELILCDDDFESATHAIVQKKEAAVPALLELLRSDLFKDPLFPGYGLAPLRAAFALGEIQSEKAIPSLFDLLGEEDPAYEEIALAALRKIGTSAKQFLKKTLTSLPITKETERAAFAILQFIEDEEIPLLCLELLSDPLYVKSSFAPYLVTGCEALQEEKRALSFLNL